MNDGDNYSVIYYTVYEVAIYTSFEVKKESLKHYNIYDRKELIDALDLVCWCD